MFLKVYKKINFIALHNNNQKEKNNYMKYRFLFFLLISFQIHVQAQLPSAANGKWATVNGKKIYYEESGSGMPLLLIHGFGATAAIWEAYTKEFSKSYRVIAVDMPGHGRSDYMDTTNVYLHKKAAEYIIGLLDQLSIDSTHIMGTSSGGFISLYITTMRPQLAKKIVVIGGQVYYSATTRNVITSKGGPDTSSYRIKTHGKEKAHLLARQFWNFRKLYGDPSFTPDVLTTIKAVTLIVHGDNDPIAPVSNALEMYKYIPKAYLWVVPNGGHVPTSIKKNEGDFIRRSLEFLRDEWERK
ncbi:MAG: alpha/beta hydrolase [Nitrosopumilus sp.]|nr:alpha/beta hydrolase [Nitrosopumilus sp.]